jgi:AcrR family transcriptional regulator
VSIEAHKCTGTREKVLATASEVFAEKGFRRATVRQIAARAGVNLNAVNYHFGDKEGLYRAVIESAHQAASEGETMEPFGDRRLPPEERLRGFIAAFLRRALATHRASHVARLMAMEIIEPTEALDVVVDKFVRPRFELLCGVIRELTAGRLPPRQVRSCAQSIVAQCIHFAHARPIISRLLPELEYTADGVERMAEHVARFSLAALAHLRTNGEAAK